MTSSRRTPKRAATKRTATKRAAAKTTATKRTATKRTATKRAAAKTTTRAASTPPAAAQPPVIPPGQRLHVLCVPFPERGVATANGARWHPGLRQTIYIGTRLPYGLTPYASPDHSWERFLEDDLNPQPALTSRGPSMTLRPHQRVAATAIAAAHARGYRGFLEADDVGLGKTLASLYGALAVAARTGATRILIMCPKGVIPHWRRTIAATHIPPNIRFVVINYDQAKKLLAVPASAQTAKRTRTKNKRTATQGVPLVEWDIVIADESHKLKNASQRRAAFSRVARYQQAATTAPFVLWLSATAGQNPVELGYLAPLLAQVTGSKRSDLADFGPWLAQQGFAVTHNPRYDTWEWGITPPEATPEERAAIQAARARDLARIHDLLFTGATPPGLRRLPTDIAGWPAIQRILAPVDLDHTQQAQYRQAWGDFRRDMRLAHTGRDSQAGRAAQLRFRQKASLLRVPGTVDRIVDAIDNGHQVVVSVEFLDTLDAIRDDLAAQGIGCGEFSGRTTADREHQRIAFQQGAWPVMLFTVCEGVSLHAGEQLPDGTHATLTPRTTLVHDPRYSGLETIQIEGRAHRDSQAANVYYCLASGTVEEGIVGTLLSRVASTKQMLGDDVSTVRALEDELARAALTDAAIPDDVHADTPTAPGLGSQPVTPPPVPVPASKQSAPARTPATSLAAQLSEGKPPAARRGTTAAERAEFAAQLRRT